MLQGCCLDQGGKTRGFPMGRKNFHVPSVVRVPFDLIDVDWYKFYIKFNDQNIFLSICPTWTVENNTRYMPVRISSNTLNFPPKWKNVPVLHSGTFGTMRQKADPKSLVSRHFIMKSVHLRSFDLGSSVPLMSATVHLKHKQCITLPPAVRKRGPEERVPFLLGVSGPNPRSPFIQVRWLIRCFVVVCLRENGANLNGGDARGPGKFKSDETVPGQVTRTARVAGNTYGC